MSNKYFITCRSCGFAYDLKPLLFEHKLDHRCPKCRKQDAEFFSNSSKLGMKLLRKAIGCYRADKDYNLAIFLSASAVDCYISELYLKWSHIKEARSQSSLGKQSIDDKVLRELSKTQGFKPRANNLIKVLPGISLPVFFDSNDDISSLILERFGSVEPGSFINDINKTLMEKSKHIAHVGEKVFEKSEAMSCINCAILFIMVFYLIDIKYTGRHPFPAKHGRLEQVKTQPAG